MALGHWQPDQRLADDYPRYVVADGELARAAQPTCETLREDLDPAVCRPRRSVSDGAVEIRSSYAEYNPAYYLIAGLPLRAESGEVGAWAVRLLGALISALLMAWAWSLVVSRQATAWPGIAMLIATTPAIYFATTIAAPNGVSFAAGVLLWAGLLTAVRDPASSGPPIAAGVGAAVLVLTHATGIIWLGASVLTVLILCGWRGAWSRVGRCRRAWSLGTALVAAAALFAISWNLVYEPNAFSAASVADEPLVAETKAIPMVAHVVMWLFQTIGVMPTRFGLLWIVIYALWLAPLGYLLVRAARAGTGRERAAGSTAVAIAVLVPAVATATTYASIGVGWQGRYELPLLVGIVMLAGAVMDRGVHIPGRLRVPVIVLLAVTQALSVACVGLREARGPFDDGRPWTPLIWAVAPILVGVGYFLLARAARIGSVKAE